MITILKNVGNVENRKLTRLKNLANLFLAIEIVTKEPVTQPNLTMSLLDDFCIDEIEEMLILNFVQGQEIVNKWKDLSN